MAISSMPAASSQWWHDSRGPRGHLEEVPVTSTDIYDVANNVWYPTGPLGMARSGHTATALVGSSVLVASGDDGAAELATARAVRFPAWPRRESRCWLLASPPRFRSASLANQQQSSTQHATDYVPPP